MIFPLDLSNLSLLFAITAIIALITAELLSPYYRRINIKINRKRLNNTSLVLSSAFLLTVTIKVINIIIA